MHNIKKINIHQNFFLKSLLLSFTFFLLFFYSNIIGLNPGLAGLAIFIALCFDAVTDPLMGTISDNTILPRLHR